MKNILKLLFAGVFITGVVFGIIFLINNSDLDNQVFNEFTSENYLSSIQSGKDSLDYLCELSAVNLSMEGVKTEFLYVKKTMSALNLKMNKLIAVSSSTSGAYKKDNDLVLSAQKKYKASYELLRLKERLYFAEYNEYTSNTKADGYNMLLGIAIEVVENAIRLINELENYNYKYVCAKNETPSYQDALLNIMFELSKNININIFNKENYSVALINELNAIMVYYDSLNSDYSVEPSNNISASSTRLNAYRYLVANNLFNSFIANENKAAYIGNLNGLDKTNAECIYILLGGSIL